MKNTIKNQPSVRNTEKDFDIIKMEPISVGNRKNSIERYIATLSDGTKRNFKRCASECGEMLTYESFSNYKSNKDGRRNECGQCISKYSRKKKAENVAKARKDGKRICSVCNEEKKISEYTTDGKGYRKECRKCKVKNDILRNHARKSRKHGLHVKLDGEGIEEFKSIVMNAACVLTGSFENVSNDHIIPTSLKGGSHIGNLLPIRRELNSSKGSLPFFLWIRTKNFRDISKKYGVEPGRVQFYIEFAAYLNRMTSDQYERYTLFVWKMQQNEETKHITANPTKSEALEYSTGGLTWLDHEDVRYYRPTITAQERAEIYAKFDAEQAIQ
ncbi:hypothetical protein S3E15_00334 [Bacillus mycoides]|uniref:HNH endonuclease n=3 Tax=Bacillaceae TaxID=186817 RepID=A0AAP8BHP6_BACMY|nr:hypothetical protein IKO_02309 [Bacillus cereus VDM034]OSX96703.1 hypothetical protein S3E15_00334 [Bacillus mycoides]PRD11648.1 hypothetical protein CQ058_03705 [Bacillus sp. MYb56]QWI22494.1 hypothetical protein EXW34_14565 [Bacillus mycoides]